MSDDHVGELVRESREFVESLDQDPLVGQVIQGNADRRAYVQFLISTYHYVRWSGFLLAKTGEGLRRSGRCPFLLALVEAKAEEEAPHDGWVLDDLRTLGVNAELVKGGAIPTAVQAYVQWSAALAERGSPAFLGAAYTLEFISMQRAGQAARNLRTRQKIANIDASLSFLESHGEADIAHVATLEDLLRQVRVQRDRDEIRLSSAVLRSLYPSFFTAAKLA